MTDGETLRCVLEAGHRDPEIGTDHAGPVQGPAGRTCWSDSAIGATPHVAETDTRQEPAPVPFFERLVELSRLEDGWLDGQGKAPSLGVLQAASRLCEALPAALSPHVYPTAPGGVQLEWEDQHGQHYLEVQPDQHLFLLSVDREEQQELAALRAEVAAARKFAGEMRDFCSPHGVAADYADRLLEAMNQAREGRP